jgi:hypothetical protein
MPLEIRRIDSLEKEAILNTEEEESGLVSGSSSYNSALLPEN